MSALFFATAISLALPADANHSDWHLEATAEYSTYVDAVARLTSLEGGPRDYGYGLRIAATRTIKRLALGSGLSLFPTPRGVSGSLDLLAYYDRRWSRLRLLAGGGAGVFFASDGSFIPTHTGKRAGPSLSLTTELQWSPARHFYVTGGVGLYLYPIQPFATLPVGLDLRFFVGPGVAF
jgi:hypothetical protein